MNLTYRTRVESTESGEPSTDRLNTQDAELDTPESQAPANSPPQTTPSPRLIRSRRRRWLTLNPSYFQSASSDLELADPLSYDRFIRQHQTPSERQQEGKARGWAKTLETSLLRGEAKLAEIDPASSSSRSGAAGLVSTRDTDWSIGSPSSGLEAESMDSDGADIELGYGGTGALSSVRGQLDTSLTAPTNEPDTSSHHPDSQQSNTHPTTADEGKLRGELRWQDMLASRFIRGEDEDFDYAAIDVDDALDADEGLAGGWVERQQQEKWFEDEDSEEHNTGELQGQTGVQDF